MRTSSTIRIPLRFGSSVQSDLQVRQAALDDVPQVAILFDEYRQSAGKPSDLPNATLFIADRVKKRDSHIFIALKNAVPVGFIQLFRQYGATSMRPIWYVQDLFVKAENQGQQIGTALINSAKAFARQDNSLLTLKTRLRNIKAQALYERLNFRRDDTSEKFVFYEWEEKSQAGSKPPELSVVAS